MKSNWLPWQHFHAAAAWGAALSLVLFFSQTAHPHDDQWARLLLQLAILVWVPLGLSLLKPVPKFWNMLVFPAGLCAVIAMQLPVGGAAAVGALPWVVFTAVLFVSGVEQMFRADRRVAQWALASARIFILIGGLSLLADRLGVQLLGFDPAIILLTAVHFHYAGFVFLLLLGLAAEHFPNSLFRWAAGLAVISVPLTAAGITFAQVNGSFVLEALAAATVAGAGYLGAFGYLQLLRRRDLPATTRICWTTMALCLIFSMSLGLGYALRPYFSIEWLNIPFMRAWHGSVNGLGLAGLGLAGWKLLPQMPFKTHGRN